MNDGHSVIIRLHEVGCRKVDTIKAVRALTGLGLKEAKGMVDEADGVVLYDGPVTPHTLTAYQGLIDAGAVTSTDEYYDLPEEQDLIPPFPEVEAFPEVHVKKRRARHLWLWKS